jgi:hypothetical protein
MRQPHFEATITRQPRDANEAVTLYWGERRITILEVIDQRHGPGYRYVKVKGYDRNVYILRFDQIRDAWDVIMFSSERAPRLSTGAAYVGPSGLWESKPRSQVLAVSVGSCCRG